MAVDTMRLGKSDIVNSALKNMETNLHAQKMATFTYYARRAEKMLHPF